MALPGNLVCHATMAICGIVFIYEAMATAKNWAMATAMTVALEEEGDDKGGKSNGDGEKVGDSMQR